MERIKEKNREYIRKDIIESKWFVAMSIVLIIGLAAPIITEIAQIPGNLLGWISPLVMLAILLVAIVINILKIRDGNNAIQELELIKETRGEALVIFEFRIKLQSRITMKKWQVGLGSVLVILTIIINIMSVTGHMKTKQFSITEWIAASAWFVFGICIMVMTIINLVDTRDLRKDLVELVKE